MNTNEGIAMQAVAGSPKPLPVYTCHKQVQALKIKVVVRQTTWQGRETALLQFDNGFVDIWVDADFVEKHNPQAGGYFVIYKDGYRSWSPAQAFEEGYTLDKTEIVR